MKRVYTILTVLTLLSVNLFAKEKSIEAILNDANIRKVNDSILIQFSIPANKLNIDKSSFLELTPALVYKDSKKILELKPILVNGSRRQKYFERNVKISGFDIYSKYLDVVNIKKINPDDEIKYSQKIKYETWMNESSVVLLEGLCGCGGKSLNKNSYVLSDKINGSIEKPAPEFKVAFVKPTPEKIKSREISGQAFVIFPVNKSVLFPELANNSSELAKIINSIEEIKKYPGAEITGISIEAYASPEGYIQNNITLSENRASALKDYLKNRYSFNDKIFNVKSKGENWTGLNEEIKKAPFTENEKVELLQILKIEDLAARKTALKSYKSGKPYEYLLKNSFSGLRRSDYKISYKLPGFDENKTAELLKTNPAMLSLDEMYTLSLKYNPGSPEFNDVFDIAVRLFPFDVAANINAAAIELQQKNLNKAKVYLNRINDKKEAYNNIGVLKAYENELQTATEYFKMAIQSGSEEAVDNLKILNNYIN